MLSAIWFYIFIEYHSYKAESLITSSPVSEQIGNIVAEIRHLYSSFHSIFSNI